jgi:hypothetical protein
MLVISGASALPILLPIEVQDETRCSEGLSIGIAFTEDVGQA